MFRYMWSGMMQDFYPRPPRGGRPRRGRCSRSVMLISIHALREEGDEPGQKILDTHLDFYPRPPRGGRLDGSGDGKGRLHFYPRPPRGGRRADEKGADEWESISIHALREEGDRLQIPHKHDHRNFYPRPPRGGRPDNKTVLLEALGISIHALREEGDIRHRTDSPFHFHFYPRPPRGGRHFNVDTFVDNLLFLSTPSARRATTAQCYLYKINSISIHALREEGDSSLNAGTGGAGNFYPRPPRGGRQRGGMAAAQRLLFLSTPSARRATRFDNYSQ